MSEIGRQDGTSPDNPWPHGRGRFSSSPPRQALPARTCDCHVHVLGPYAAYPLTESRSYTPPEARLDDLERVMTTLGVERLVLVQPSVYGSDNRCMLDAMQGLGARTRGVAVISAETSQAELEAMHAAGVRGVRINARTGRPPKLDALRASLVDASTRVAPLGWHVQVYLPGEYLEHLAPALRSLPTDFVVDHLGDVDLRAGAGSPARAALLRMIETGRCWVKISGIYRLAGGDDSVAVAGLLRELWDLRPDRLVWASDWPHTGGGSSTRADASSTEPLRSLDTGAILDMLAELVPDPALRWRILVENPAQLYQF